MNSAEAIEAIKKILEKISPEDEKEVRRLIRECRKHEEKAEMYLRNGELDKLGKEVLKAEKKIIEAATIVAKMEDSEKQIKAVLKQVKTDR